jgi:hypothetical protein
MSRSREKVRIFGYLLAVPTAAFALFQFWGEFHSPSPDPEPRNRAVFISFQTEDRRAIQPSRVIASPGAYMSPAATVVSPEGVLCFVPRNCESLELIVTFANSRLAQSISINQGQSQYIVLVDDPAESMDTVNPLRHGASQ